MLPFGRVTEPACAEKPVPRFGPPQFVAEVPPSALLSHVVDLDGDADQDLLLLSLEGGNVIRISWLQQIAEDQFEEVRLFETDGAGAARSLAADIDADGDVDVLIDVGGRWAWLDNDGGHPPRFESRELGIFDGGRILMAVDLDADGDQDILAFASDIADVADILMWENEGSGVFMERRVFETWDIIGLGPAAFETGDFEGDGDIDLFTKGEFGTTHLVLVWDLNDGQSPPRFERERLFFDEEDTRGRVHVSDLDGDGDLDAVLSHPIKWYENDPSTPGGFVVHPITPPAPESVIAAVGDFNSDGLPDLVLLSSSNRGVVAFCNQGGDPPTFTAIPLFEVEEGIVWGIAAVVDMNGDDQLDLLGRTCDPMGPTACRFLWYPNLGPGWAAARRPWRLYE